MPSTAGSLQLGNGIWPRESPDGTSNYFFTDPSTRVLNDLVCFSLAVGDRYLYLFQKIKSANPRYRLIQFEPESKTTQTLADISFQPRSAYLSRDQHFLYLTQQEDPKRRVVLLRGLF
jgi:hypothetical protein